MLLVVSSTTYLSLKCYREENICKCNELTSKESPDFIAQETVIRV